MHEEGDAPMLGNDVPAAGALRKAPGFLRRKFQPPALPDPCLEESGVVGVIEDLDAWRVCLVAAAAGYGKTTLLTRWHRRFRDEPACVPLWMDLDRYDAVPARFLQALCHCLCAVDPRFGELERQAGELGAGDDVEPCLIDFVNLSDEACDPATTYVLFLDSYECASSDDLDDVVRFLVSNMGDFIRFVVAGSYLSPAIDDLRFSAEIVEVSTEDLMLDEGASFPPAPCCCRTSIPTSIGRSATWAGGGRFPSRITARRANAAQPPRIPAAWR